MTISSRYQQARRVTIVSATINFLLGVVKLIAGIWGHSQALIADGIHSFSDLLTDGLVLFASKYGSRVADHDHPYGHRRIETAATLGLGLVVILAGAGIIYDAVLHLLGRHGLVKPSPLILLVAIVSIVANEWLYRFNLRYAKKIGSKLLQANAWHNRSDAASSLVVLLGIIGSLLGYLYLDSVAAVIVGLFIIKMGWDLLWSSVQELVDKGLDDAKLKLIEQTITQVAGVKALHQLRTRSMGGKIFLDVHILVDSRLSVSEGHYIGEQVNLTLLREVKDVADVTVHVDPEDDEAFMPSQDLPDRAKLVNKLRACWQGLPGQQDIMQVRLHYLRGLVDVEIWLPVSIVTDKTGLESLTKQYQAAVANIPEIATVTVLFHT